MVNLMTSVVILLILIFCILAYTEQTFFSKPFSMQYQGIRISYDLVVFIPVEELLKQETA